MIELIKWLISVVLVVAVGGLIIMYPEILLAVPLFFTFICLASIVEKLIFDD